MTRPLWIAACLAVLVLQACATPEAMREGSRPLTATEVEELFSGRTWNWQAGGGYFAPDHEFRAWSRDEFRRPGYAIGRWRATDAGLLCFEAPWRFAGNRNFDESCFRHRVADGTIYQRAEPAGSWFVLRSDPPRQDDAGQALVPGDQIGPYVAFISSACASPFRRCRLPEDPRAVDHPLSAEELTQLFAGMTWQWANGAGYFMPGGSFQGWATDQAGRPGYSIGRWTVDDAGVLCIEGPWTYGDETATSTRCFAHRRENGTIYQRAEPAGAWYVFRGTEPGAAEYDKFVAGDIVSPKLKEIRGR